MRLWSIAGLCVGGIIGAGFASGHELTVFFVNYGWGGLVGIAVATGLLLLGMMAVLEISARHKVRSYVDLFAVLDPRLEKVFDLLYSLFLLIGLSVMLAGMGSMGSTALSGLFFRLGSALLVIVILSRGVEGVLKMSGWIAPGLVVVLCVVAASHLRREGIALPSEGSWLGPEAAALYACYNLGFSLALLASLHQHLPTSRQRWQVALVVSLVLGCSMVILYFALVTLSPEQQQAAFPLVHVVANWSSLTHLVYEIMLWTAMYTTAVANSFALVTRIEHTFAKGWSLTAVLVVGAGLGLSYFGFHTLIRVAYPILGLAGLWILAHLLREYVR